MKISCWMMEKSSPGNRVRKKTQTRRKTPFISFFQCELRDHTKDFWVSD